VDFNLLRKLLTTFGPSGYEDQIRDVIRQEIEPLVDEIRVDPLGNLVAMRSGNGDASATEKGKKILLAAHMDEIGVMATHIDKKGFVRFTQIGGVRPLNSVGARVRFANGTLGVIYAERQDDSSKLPKLEQLYMDVGATGPDDSPIQVGDPAVFVYPLEQQGTRLISKTMDDRIGCYALIETMRQLKDAVTPHEIYFVFSSQEEITLSGARTAAFRIDPDIAIAVDVTGTGDLPKALPMNVKLGEGPAVKVKDSGMIAHPMVRDMLVNAAQKANVPYQMEVLLGGTTDASAMQLVRAGVPSGCLSIPCRYVHSPSEMVDAEDVENAIKVLLTALQNA
jgi:endoglucanase